MRRSSWFLAAVAAVAVPVLPAATVRAASIVQVATPAGLYAPVDVALDGPGVISVNTSALDASGHYVVGGPCVLTYAAGFNVGGPVNGAVCTGPGTVHFRTTGQLAYTCAYDGAVLESKHLTVKVDGVVQYDQQLWPVTTVCYVTPAPQAAVAWTPGTLTFTNTAARPSASTTFILAQSAWNYSTHAFTVPAGVTCSANLVHVGTRYVWHWGEQGFKCSAVVPAASTLMMTIL